MSDLTDRLLASRDAEKREAAARITEVEAQLAFANESVEIHRIQREFNAAARDEARAQIAAALAQRLDHGAQGNGYAQLVYRMRTALSSPVTRPEPEPTAQNHPGVAEVMEFNRRTQQWLARGGVVKAPELAADRRVAPDRETRDKLREVVAGDVLGGWNEHHCIENQGCTVCAGNRAVDALLASGVLGIPVQRTADRETIARVLDQWVDGFGKRAAEANHRTHLAQADAVLAVLVPADLIRAEAMTEAAGIATATREYIGGAGTDGKTYTYHQPVHPHDGQEIGRLLSVRAAEYRKQAS